MKQQILEYVRKKGGGVSFVELCRDIEGFKGVGDNEKSVWLWDNNILLWNGVTDEAIDAIKELLSNGLLICKPTALLVYAVDGCMIDMPIAKSINKVYKSSRWMPVCFSLPKKGGTE